MSSPPDSGRRADIRAEVAVPNLEGTNSLGATVHAPPGAIALMSNVALRFKTDFHSIFGASGLVQNLQRSAYRRRGSWINLISSASGLGLH